MRHLELACQLLVGIGQQLDSFGNGEVAEEFAKTIRYLDGFRARYLKACSSQLVLAQPGDVPKPLLR